MKKIIFITCVIFYALPGCKTSYDSAYLARLPHVPVDYEIIGNTSGEETRTAVLFIDWGNLTSEKIGSIEGDGGTNLPFFLVDAAKRAALYKALQKIPAADKLIEPRWKIDVSNFLLFKTVTVKVWGKAIKYTKSSPITIK